MKSLTLAVRTLREDARAPVQWLLRSALVVTFLVMVVVQYGSRSTVGAAGRDLFEALVWTNFWFLIVVGSALFSSVITEEKEQGTLGLLQLAGFGAPSILLGKSIGELTSAALLLAVQLPFAMLTVTLGGVSAHQVLAAFAQLGAFTVAVYGLALLSSVVCQRSAGAARLTLGLVVVGAFGTWFLEVLLYILAGAPQSFTRPAWLGDLEQLSPGGALSKIAATGFAEPVVTWAVLVSLGVGALAVLLAALWFAMSTTQALPVAPPRVLVPGGHGRPRPGARALGWKEYHFAGLGRLGLLLRLAVVAAVLVLVSALLPADISFWGGAGVSRYAIVCVTALSWMFWAFALDSAYVGGRLFQEETRWHTLPGLFTLPISLRRWVIAKALGAARVAVPTLAGLVITGVGCIVGFDPISWAKSDFVAWVLFSISLALFAMHLAAYLSLRLRRGALAVTVASCAAGVRGLEELMSRVFASDSASFVILALVFLGASVLLQFAILRRLRRQMARQD